MGGRLDELNGLSLEKLQEILAVASSQPERIRRELGNWRARAMWTGGFSTKVFVRNHAISIDEPSELAGQDKGPNAVEYVLAALGACLTVGFILNATKEGIKVHNLEIAVEGSLNNILTFLGLSQEGHAGYDRIGVKCYVRADADEETLSRIWEETLRFSPVANTLTKDKELKAELSIIR